MAKNKIWLIGDPHLGHDKVAKARGFRSTDDHDTHIKERVRDTVNPHKDTLIVLGDVAFDGYGSAYIKHFLPCANVRCVMGNHDVGDRMPQHWRLYGSYDRNGVLFSHLPVMLSMAGEKRWKFNIHAHTHGHQLSSPYHFSVSLETTNMRPILLDDALKIAEVKSTGNFLL